MSKKEEASKVEEKEPEVPAVKESKAIEPEVLLVRHITDCNGKLVEELISPSVLSRY